VSLGVPTKEGREQAFDGDRRGGNPQRMDVAPAQRAGPFAQHGGMREQAAAVAYELLAARSEQEPAASPLEQGKAQLLLEARDLARQRGLGDVQRQGGFGDGAPLGDGHEGSQTAEVHAHLHMPDRHGKLESVCIGHRLEIAARSAPL